MTETYCCMLHDTCIYFYFQNLCIKNLLQFETLFYISIKNSKKTNNKKLLFVYLTMLKSLNDLDVFLKKEKSNSFVA